MVNSVQFNIASMLTPGVEQSTYSRHSLPVTVQHYCQVMIVSMQAIKTRLASYREEGK